MVRYCWAPRDHGEVDDIDHLQNKRVRAVGELLQSQLRTGFMRTERVAKERMTSMDPEEMVPGNVISTKPISAAINSFFGSGQLSQFMDEVNPLSELSHTRRVSALGPGGLSKQSAKLRSATAPLHYGASARAEPGGALVGLNGYLALHAKLTSSASCRRPTQGQGRHANRRDRVHDRRRGGALLHPPPPQPPVKAPAGSPARSTAATRGASSSGCRRKLTTSTTPRLRFSRSLRVSSRSWSTMTRCALWPGRTWSARRSR